ncbi:MAG: PLP-dependent aminotransferase family protein [bacterium]
MEKFVSIHLNKESKKPLYLQLHQEIVRLIDEGILENGEKLPPIRKLSKFLKVNPITVVSAYKLLEEENYIRTRVGSGTYVVPRKLEAETESVSQNIRYNFASASLSPDLFPTEEFKSAIVKVLDEEKGYAFDYGESEGYRPLRDAINRIILTSSGIKVDVEDIYIVSGGQQGIEIVAKTLLDYQDTVYIESPTYPGAISAFRSRSARIVEIPIKEDGIDIDDLKLKLKLKPPKLLYIMSSFQNPTGYSYSENKKEELLNLAERFDFYILEDDHLSELYYLERVQPLKALDKTERVFYLRSFSKILMPGLRLGFIVSPKEYRNRISEAKYFSDISSSSLIQKALNIILTRGEFDAHIARIRNIFSRRWKLMFESLNRYMPEEISYTLPKGGLYIWLNLPKGFNSRELYYRAIERGVTFVPGDIFLLESHHSEGLRLSFAQIPEEEIKEGIKELAEYIREFILEPRHKRIIRESDYRILV